LEDRVILYLLLVVTGKHRLDVSNRLFRSHFNVLLYCLARFVTEDAFSSEERGTLFELLSAPISDS